MPHRPMGFFNRKDRHGRMVTHPITQHQMIREPQVRLIGLRNPHPDVKAIFDDEQIVEAVESYNRQTGAPASPADVTLRLTGPGAPAILRGRLPGVHAQLDELARRGRLMRVNGGFVASNPGKMTLTFPDGTTIQAKNTPGVRAALRRIVAGLGSAAALPARTRAAFEEGEIAKLIERSQDRNLVVRLAAQRAFRRRFPEVYREFREQTHVPTVRGNPIWFDRDNTLSIGNGPIPLSFLHRLKAEGKDVGVASKNLSDKDIRILREVGIKASRNKHRVLNFATTFVDDTPLWRKRAEAKGVKALSPREALREL